jgi:hypothetical protein
LQDDDSDSNYGADYAVDNFMEILENCREKVPDFPN